MANWLCKIGLHSWRLFNGSAVVQGDTIIVLCDRECRRCGKTGTDGWVA